MSAEVVSYEDAAARFERDRKVFRLRLNGVPVRQIAETLHCTPEEAQAAVIRMCGGVTPDLRTRTIEIDLERLDDLNQIYYQKARAGDHEACALVIRLMERRARMLGLDIQPRGETALHESMPRPQTSTDKIMEALERLAHGPVIEGEAVEEPKPVGGDDA